MTIGINYLDALFHFLRCGFGGSILHINWLYFSSLRTVRVLYTRGNQFPRIQCIHNCHRPLHGDTWPMLSVRPFPQNSTLWSCLLNFFAFCINPRYMINPKLDMLKELCEQLMADVYAFSPFVPCGFWSIKHTD